jgi:hypothetical protein
VEQDAAKETQGFVGDVLSDGFTHRRLGREGAKRTRLNNLAGESGACALASEQGDYTGRFCENGLIVNKRIDLGRRRFRWGKGLQLFPEKWKQKWALCRSGVEIGNCLASGIGNRAFGGNGSIRRPATFHCGMERRKHC